jgi:tRNA (mo5U34)-methyltransferase
MALSEEEKLKMIKSVKYWYHTIDLGDGLQTPGWENIRGLNQAMLDFLPLSLQGMSVLDIGCWDGLFSFEAEKRGARPVLAIDNLSGGDGFFQETLEPIKGEGFKPLQVIKTLLDSNVEYQNKNVYDISPESMNMFDCTFFFGVLYHLWHPMLALQRVRQVTRKCLFIETHVNETIVQSKPLIQFYPRTEKYEATTWVGPNLLALFEMLHVVGFKKVILYRFRDYFERAIGIALVEERYLEEFQFNPDDRFVLFNPMKPGLEPGNEMEEQAKEIETVRESLQLIKSSKSWRITAPLRRTLDKWNRLRSRFKKK